MLLKIPDILTKLQVTELRARFDTATWIDGKESAGHQSIKVKNNLQLGLNDPLTHEVGMQIIDALEKNPVFVSAALPLKVSPPLFNKYQDGGYYGTHIDSAIRQIPNTPHRLRTDLSATLFLSEPDEYEGGELIIEDSYGTYALKLPAGHLVLYESGSLHNVTPVTNGARIASFMWVQSMIRSSQNRILLLDLDNSIQTLTNQGSDANTVTQLTGVYHNLLRMWSDV
jgi:PKHD-type hydroxylase